MKYTAILAVLFALYWLWKFIGEALERGLPTHPAYYISAIVAVVLGFLTYRLTKKNIAERRYVLLFGVFMLLFFVMIIAFHILGGEILESIGSALFFWFILSSLGFWGYFMIRKWSSKKDLTEGEEIQESVAKGYFWAMLIIAILLAPLLIFIFIMMLIF